MSMLHKAFCFNTGSFRDELYPIIMKAAADGEISGIIAFIEGNIDSISSPYTEDPIEKDWISELEEVDFQSLADFALTRYYDICEDIGLEYSWAALSEYLTVAEMKHDASYYVLGESVANNGVVLDPGGMGMGFVDAESVSGIKAELLSQQDVFKGVIRSIKIETMYNLTTDELETAYLSLIAIYAQAESDKTGLMFTF